MRTKILTAALAVTALLYVTGNAAAANIGVKCNVGGLDMYSRDINMLGYRTHTGSTVSGQYVNVNLAISSLPSPKLYKMELQKDGSTKCSFWISITQAGTIDILTKIDGCTYLQKVDSTHIYVGVDSSVSTQATWTYSFVGQVQVAKKTGKSDCCRYQTSSGTYGWITDCYRDGSWMRGKKNNLDIIINIENQRDVQYWNSGRREWKQYGTTSTPTTQNTWTCYTDWTCHNAGQVLVAEKNGNTQCRYQTSTGTYEWITNCYKYGDWMKGKKNNLDMAIKVTDQKNVWSKQTGSTTWQKYGG
ncbi:MAG: hypothetical protein JW724_05815 [Candidatus Altiarchaeota archaeon]|nr:hypothetical protein [Candidatus Altiarchaeota archaeon]